MAPRLIMVLTAALCFTLLASPAPFPPGGQAAWAQEAKPAAPAAPKGKITISGGPGDSVETAFIISGAPNSQIGIAAEYRVLEKKFGVQNVDWQLKRQGVMRQQGKTYDRMEVELKGGKQKTVFFDISDFFGKF